MKKLLLLFLVLLALGTGVAQAATTTYTYNNAAIGRSFPYSDGNGQHALLIETLPTGTDAKITIRALGAGTVYVTVDGGAETSAGTYTNTGLSTDFTLFSALTDAQHDVTIRITGQANIAFVSTFLTVTGAAPAIALPSRFGTQHTFRSVSYIQTDGVALAAGNTVNSIQSVNVGGVVGGRNVSMRFRAQISALRVMGYRQGAGNGTIKLLRRTSGSVGAWTDVGNADVSFATTAEWHYGVTISGLDNTTEWEYQLVYLGTGSFYLYGMDVTGTGLNTATLASQGYICFWGDSITANYGLTDGSQGWVYKLCKALGLTAFNAGSPGETVASTATRSASVGTTLTSAPRAFVVHEGVNDNINESGGTATTFQTNATTTLNNFVAAWPTAKGLVFGLLPKSGQLTHTATDAAWQAAVNAEGANWIFYTSNGVTNGINDPTANADFQSDGIHPNDQGGTKIATFLQPKVVALFDTTPPTFTSAATNSAGTTVTVTLSEAIAGSTGFTVVAGGVTRTLGTVTPSGSTEAISISGVPIQLGQTVTVAYTPGNITDIATNALATFGAQAVTNNSTYTLPTAPTGAIAAIVNIPIVLTFNRVTNAVSYKIYKNGSGTPLTTVTDPGSGTTWTYTDSLPKNTAATYQASTIDIYNAESSLTAVITGSAKLKSGGGGGIGLGH